MSKDYAAAIKAAHTCKSVLMERGYQVYPGRGKEDRCKCPFHVDNKPSLEIDREKDLWICRAGCGGGSVIDLLAKFEGMDPKAWLTAFAKQNGNGACGAADRPPSVLNSKNGTRVLSGNSRAAKDDLDPFNDELPPKNKAKIVQTYSYVDANGTEVYQAVRYEPKDFTQRRPDGRGGWIWNMQGVERVLYRLPEVTAATEVWIVEGEKDADGLCALGFTATCNVGGAGKWLDSYSDSLKGKDVILCGDEDKPGKDHMDKVRDSVEKSARSVRYVRVPAPNKDISQYLEGLSDGEAYDAAKKLLESVPAMYGGETLPLYNWREMRTIYIRSRNYDRQRVLRLGSWLPAMSGYDMVPGDLVFIIAETGVGKTAILSNMALHSKHLSTLFFEQEVALQKLYERSVQSVAKVGRDAVRQIYDEGKDFDENDLENMGHILFCEEPRLTIERIDSIIRRSELRFGKKPDMVVVDYFQLMRSLKKERYDMFSDMAEGLKIAAKQRDVIIVCASQVSRGEREYGNLGLNDGKESGAIENSSGLLLGASRNPDDPSEMCLQVIKSTEFGAGLKVYCDYDVRTLRIKQKRWEAPGGKSGS